MPCSLEEARDQARIGGRDPLPIERGGAVISDRLGRRDPQAQRPKPSVASTSSRGSAAAEREFLEHILADDAELADAVADEGRDVVVANEHQLGREILDPRGEVVLAGLDAEARRRGARSRLCIGQAARFLDARCAGGCGQAALRASSGASISRGDSRVAAPGEEAGDTNDGRRADPGRIVDFAVGQAVSSSSRATCQRSARVRISAGVHRSRRRADASAPSRNAASAAASSVAGGKGSAAVIVTA